MTVRVVLAVAFALALAAAAQPAVDHATRTRDAASLRADADRVADAVAALHRRNDPGESLATAPRRSLRLDLPADATLAVHNAPPRLVSRLPNGPGHRHVLPVRVVTCGVDGTLQPSDGALAGGHGTDRALDGTQDGTDRALDGTPDGTGQPLDGRVTLAYVDRADGPVVVALRGFIRGDGATASHACTPGPLRERRPRLRV